MKKLKPILISALLAASWSVLAGSPSYSFDTSPAFSGFYVSGGIGAQHNVAEDFTNDITISVLASNGVVLGRSNNSIDANNRLSGTIVAGYGQQIADSGFYLGGQAGINLGSFNLHATDSFTCSTSGVYNGEVDIDTSVNVKMNSAEFIADFKPGYVFGNDFMLYGLVGLGVTQAQTSHDTTLSSKKFASPEQFSNSHKKTVTGLRLGAGIEKMISENWSIGFNYVYTSYRQIVSATERERVIPINEKEWRVFNNTSSKFEKHAAMLTVSRYFA